MIERADVIAHSFEVLFAENPAAVYVFDTAGRFVAGNRVLAERSGIPWDDLRTMDFGPTVHPEDRERVSAEFRAAVGGETRHFRARGLRVDGTAFHSEVVNIPIREDGAVVGVLGIATDIDELADARSELDRTEGLMRIASHVAKLGGWAIDLETGRRYWSTEAFEVLGLPYGDAPPRDEVLAHIDPDHREILDAALTRCAGEGTPIDMTARFHRDDGSVIHVRVIGEAVRASDGRITRMQGAVSDITETVEAERERERLETRLSAALDGLDDAMVFVDADWSIRFLNRRMAQTLGRETADFIGEQLWTACEFAPEVAAMIHDAASARITAVDRRVDPGSGRWIETTVFPADDLLGIQMRDVTAVEAARSRILDDSQRLYAQASVLDSASDAIVVRGLGDGVEYANLSATELLGPDIIGRSLRELIDADADAYAAADAAVSRDGRWEGDFVVPRPGGERIIFGRWQLVRDPAGVAEGVFCALNDVTEARRQSEVLVRSQRMESIGTLAGGIAHDLNNVLTPLLLATQLLTTGESDAARLRVLDQMRQTIGRGAEMIRQVLTFARGVEGERSEVDVAELLERFREFCRDTLPKDVIVTTHAEPGLGVVGDRTQLLQVLMNLATNARDAMPSGGRLAVEARAENSTVVIEVADDGAGMTAEVAARVFEPFFTTKPMGSGTGLGLSVSQAIARTHGGALEVRSEPGRGTTFRIELPPAPGSVPRPIPEEAESTPNLAGLRVLIVDDEPEIVDLASQLVEDAGGVPTGLTGAALAKKVLATAQIDIILADLVMPGTSGRDLLAWLATHRPKMPVVAMSGVPELLTRSAESGNVHGVLDKPFTAQQLLTTLYQAAGLRQ
jgi:two-component system cell cycle sensor histidine kinase/response regulator CckA